MHELRNFSTESDYLTISPKEFSYCTQEYGIFESTNLTPYLL